LLLFLKFVYLFLQTQKDLHVVQVIKLFCLVVEYFYIKLFFDLSDHFKSLAVLVAGLVSICILDYLDVAFD